MTGFFLKKLNEHVGGRFAGEGPWNVLCSGWRGGLLSGIGSTAENGAGAREIPAMGVRKREIPDGIEVGGYTARAAAVCFRPAR